MAAMLHEAVSDDDSGVSHGDRGDDIDAVITSVDVFVVMARAELVIDMEGYCTSSKVGHWFRNAAVL